jgi:hypothetical protein
MWLFFVHAGTRAQNKRHGFLKEYIEGEERFCRLFHLLFLDEFLQEGLRELWLPVLRQAEFPQHWLSFLLSSLCLCASSLVLQAGGEVFFVARKVVKS